MRSIIILLCLISSVYLHPMHQVILNSIANKPVKEQFKLFHYIFDRPYQLNSEEALARYKVFKSNLKYINQVNSQQTDYVLGLTPFTDLTLEEFTKQYSREFPNEAPFSYKSGKKDEVSTLMDFDKLADMDDEELSEVKSNLKKDEDYRLKIKVDWSSDISPPVKIDCSFNLPFHTFTQQFEAVIKISNDNSPRKEKMDYPKLATQQLIDCAYGKPKNYKKEDYCQGITILLHDMYVWITENNGMSLQSEYEEQYDGQDFKECHKDKKVHKRAFFVEFEGCLNQQDLIYSKCEADKIDKYIFTSPYATRLDIYSRDVQNYTGGVLNIGCDRMKAYRDTLVVGLDKNPNKTYQTVKADPHFGPKWGESGYLRIIRTTDTCGLTGYANIVEGGYVRDDDMLNNLS